MTIENILKLKVEPATDKNTGKPLDISYLETNLSVHLQKAINDYVHREKER